MPFVSKKMRKNRDEIRKIYDKIRQNCDEMSKIYNKTR